MVFVFFKLVKVNAAYIVVISISFFFNGTEIQQTRRKFTRLGGTFLQYKVENKRIILLKL